MLLSYTLHINVLFVNTFCLSVYSVIIESISQRNYTYINIFIYFD